MADPTICDRCGASLERGWCQHYRGETLLESICFVCDDRDQVNGYLAKSTITTKLTMLASSSKSYLASVAESNPTSLAALAQVSESVERIRAEIKTWERRVWFAGLQADVRHADFRGFRLDFDGGHALVYSLAGRTQITVEFEDDRAQVSVITADDSREPVMGLNGIRATEEEALALLVASREAFLNGAVFKRDDKIGLGL